MEKEVDVNKFNSLIEVFQRRLAGGLVSLVLFGSRARGQGLAGSDWDVFLLAEELPDHPFERQIFLRETVPGDFPFHVSICAKTLKEFEKDFPALYLDIATDGIVLFDRDKYAWGKLQKIREIIRDAGLKRVRKFGSLTWTWKNRPAAGWRIDWDGIYGLDRRSEIQAETR